MKIQGTYFRYHYAKFSDYLQKVDMWCCQEMAKIMVFHFFEGCFWHHLINSLSFHDLKTFSSWLFIFEQCFVRIYQIFWGSIMFRQDSSWHSQRFNDFAQGVTRTSSHMLLVAIYLLCSNDFLMLHRSALWHFQTSVVTNN